MGSEVERWLGIDTTLRLAIPCRASDGNELRKLSAETSVRKKKKEEEEEEKNKSMKLIRTPTRKTVERIWEVRIPWGGRSRQSVWVGGGGCIILEGNGGEITICGCWADGRDRDGRAQRGPGTVIRSLPRRTGGCSESDWVAGWPLTACSSSGTRELWGIGETLAVNMKCDILPFFFRLQREKKRDRAYNNLRWKWLPFIFGADYIILCSI